MANIRLGDRVIKLPASRLMRIVIGVVLIIAGILGILPVLGFWMIPLGLLVLSIDLPVVRRIRRQWTVKLGATLKRHYPGLVRKFGFMNNNNHDAR